MGSKISMEDGKKIKVRSRFIVVVLIVSIAFVVGAIVATNYWRSSRDSKVAQLDRIMVAIENSGTLQEKHSQELEELRKSSIQYVRNTATLLLADDAYQKGDFTQAVDLYKHVASDRKSYMMPKAKLNLAYSFMALDESEKAKDTLLELTKSRDDILAGDMQYEAEILLAHLVEADNLPRAIEIYHNVVNSLDPENIWYMVAQARLLLFGELG